METIINNSSELSYVNFVTNKVRAIIIDSNNNIIVTKYADMFMLPGGKVDKNESLEEAIIRELKEELGIVYNIDELLPFVCYQNYIKNYKLNDSYVNKLNKTFYYIIYSDKKINYNNVELSDREKNNNFSVFNMNLCDVIKLVSSYESKNVRNSYFRKELLDVLNSVKSNNKILVKKR